MSSVSIQEKTKEPIRAFVLGYDGKPLDGLTNLFIIIHRTSDNYYFDWIDNTFKNAPDVLKFLQVMQEFYGPASPGEYWLDFPPDHMGGFDTNSITNPNESDVYVITCFQEGSPQNAANLPQFGEIRVGMFVSTVRAPVIF